MADVSINIAVIANSIACARILVNRTINIYIGTIIRIIERTSIFSGHRNIIIAKGIWRNFFTVDRDSYLLGHFADTLLTD
jgi:hypothetical protein